MKDEIIWTGKNLDEVVQFLKSKSDFFSLKYYYRRGDRWIQIDIKGHEPFCVRINQFVEEPFKLRLRKFEKNRAIFDQLPYDPPRRSNRVKIVDKEFLRNRDHFVEEMEKKWKEATSELKKENPELVALLGMMSREREEKEDVQKN